MDNVNNPMPNQAPTNPITPQSLPPKNNKSSRAWLIILVILLVITNGITAYFFYTKNSKEPTEKNPENKTQNVVEDIKIAKEIEEAEESEVKTEDEQNDKIKLAANEILVDWYEEPITSSAEELFGEERLKLHKSGTDNYSLLNVTSDIKKIGEIKDGKHKNGVLYSVLRKEMGTTNAHFIKDENNIYLIDAQKYDMCADDFYKYLCIDSDVIIVNLETPENLEIPNSNFKLIKKTNAHYATLEEYNNPTKLFEYEDDKFIYQNKPNNSKSLEFFAVAEDQSVRLYGLDFSLLTNSESEQYLGTTPKVLDITWVDATKNTDEFLQDGMGMYRGSNSYAYYIKDKNELKITGYLDNGNPIYELKDSNKKRTVEAEYTIYEDMYRMHYVPEGQEKLSFDEFIKQHLLIFWEDPFGNIIEFQNAAYAPAVEMGKPVIYLYPEKTTNVSVRVYPNNGLSITEPEYKNGWLVEALPDGTLYNYDDNQKYPYLFWEGHGLNYDMPKKGFVVAKNDVENFLVEKLVLQGLLPHEYNEFIDFWVPKMKEYDYYFITFLEQDYFDTLAPLEISPKPDTIIRVFMDYQGLDKKIEVEELEFTTPVREGFTVVEWGGALH